MKFETARILFLGEVFAAVAVFVDGPWYQGKELNTRWSCISLVLKTPFVKK